MACGQIGLDINYLYDLTPRQFFNIQKGWSSRIESEAKLSWEQTRRIVYGVLQPYIKNKGKGPVDIMPFPWDKDIDVLSDTQEAKSFDELSDKWSEIDKMKKKKIGIWQV